MSFLKKSAATLATQIALICMSMGSGIIVARVLGPELKGQVVLLTLLAQTIFMVGSLGLGSSFSFFIAKKKYPAAEIMTFALVAAMLLGGFTSVLFALTWPLHVSIWAGIPAMLLVVADVLAILYIYVTYLVRILVGHGQIYQTNMADLLRAGVEFCGVVLCVWCLSLGVAGNIGALFAATLAQIFLLCWFLRKDLRPLKMISKGLIREGFVYGMKSHALLIINFLNYRLDLLFLKYFTDDATVGIYSLAVGMAELMWLVPNATVAPLFSDVASSDQVNRSTKTLMTVRWSMIFLLVLACCGLLFGRPFIIVLYGGEFAPSYLPFLWLLPGVCLLPVFKLLAVDLAARGWPGYGTIASAVALVVNIAGNIVLIPCMGASGAALASTVSYSCMASISLVFFLRATTYRLEDVFFVSDQERKVFSGLVKKGLGKFLQ